MKRQNGLFTIHKKVGEPVEKTLCDMIIEIKLSTEEIYAASKMLKNLSNPICKETVMPDPEYGTPLYDIQEWCKKIKAFYKDMD